jgi:excisionase family DNA binding protein
VDAIDALSIERLPGVVAALAALQARAAARLASTVLSREHGKSESPAVDARSLLTIPEVAQILHVPTSHAYELARRDLPSVRLGKYVRVRRVDLDGWIEQHRD